MSPGGRRSWIATPRVLARAPAVVRLLAVAIVLAACGARPSTEPTIAPTSPGPGRTLPVTPVPTAAASPGNASPAATPAASLPVTAWALMIEGQPRTFDDFTIAPDPARPRELVVRSGGDVVGRVHAETLATSVWGSDLGTLESLVSFAHNFVDQYRDDRLGLASGSTFEAIGPTEIVVGGEPGVRFGWAWDDRAGTTERTVNYVASIPGGMVWFRAISGDAQPALPWSTFSDEAAYVRFLPALEEIVAGVVLPR